MKTEQEKKTCSLNCRIRPDIARQFIKNCYEQDKKISEVLKDCVIAYNRLMEKANGRTVHTLEFKGFDPADIPPGDYESFKKLINSGRRGIIFPSQRELKVAEPSTVSGKKK